MRPAWEARWQEENQKVTLKNVKTLAWIAMVLMMGASTLDHFTYPHLWHHFFILRSVVALLEIGLMFTSNTEFGRRHYPALMLLVPLLPAVGIAYMIFCSGDPGSPYYSGLTLCLVGFAFLFQWGFRESVLAVAITMTIYFAATLPHIGSATAPEGSFGQFFSNGVFLIMNSVVVISGSHVHQRIRRNEVISRYSLADNQAELEQKNLQLVEMDRLKTDFFSNITHELRTPLTLMIAPLQRLQRLYPAGSPQSSNGGAPSSMLHDELTGIYQNALRLLKLINDLLDLASANVGRMRISHQRFSLRLFTGRLLQSVTNMARQGDVAVLQQMPEQLEMVDSDQEKLEKILLNLLFNAVKFTPKGGSVTLVTNTVNGFLVFEVIDTGIGISQQNLPFIFDRFWQADSSVTRRHPGTGLGLALVKELATRMGGRVEAESIQGTGTTMRVLIPYTANGDILVVGHEPREDDAPAESSTVAALPPAKAEEAKEAPGDSDAAQWIKSVYREAEELQIADESEDESARSSTPALVDLEVQGDRAELPLVLIIDDEPGMLRFMHSELEPRYRVIQATDGAAGLELAVKHVPDLIVADYMMPNLDGLSLCRELRDRQVTLMLPIMLVTARSDEDVRLTALRNGANDVMVKPFSLTEFHTRVHNLVHASLLQKEVALRNAELEQTLAELRAAERDLIQSEKMAALGILTGGIMHEINNPLNFARSALFILDRRTGKLPDESKGTLKEVVSDIREGINRISTIISDLRTFCHPETVMAAACPISEPIQSAIRILSSPLKEFHIQLHEDVPADIVVRGDRNQLTLVLLNLLKNAIDALASHMTPDSEPPQIWISTRSEGTVTDILIRDNGPGIPETNLSKIFDPFFTTKPAGEGTGLGLSVCYRIITAHGGNISADTAPGGGTVFTIRMPRAIVENEEPTPSTESVAFREHVLTT